MVARFFRRGRSRLQRRRLVQWARYCSRNDALVDGQLLTARLQHPVRTNPGAFRAEGWNTGARRVLRHGA